MKRVLAFSVSALSSFVLVVGAFAGVAAAVPSDTPNGFTGACNMVEAWPGVKVRSGTPIPAGGGMENAMTVNTSVNTNGNDGMNHAVDVSGGYCP